jgi:S-adenosylmethionine hydrolase
MSLITLSTDFGWDDPYVGIMKGVILGINPQVCMIDLSHALSHQRLQQAAFMLQSAYAFFPKGSIHLAVVDPGVGGDRRLLAIEGSAHFWVGPDNGLFTMVLKKEPQVKMVHLSNSAFFLKKISFTFHGRDILAPAAAHLSLGVPLEEMGPAISDPVLLTIPEPQIKDEEITGEVLWADHFGNLITNIPQEALEKLKPGQALTVWVDSQPIREIHQTYSQGRPGNLMALIGSSGYLEIAVNLGRAAEQLGFRPSRTLKVHVSGF